ncbi:ATP-dependent helicase Lhr and Lhr-like helicase [Rhodoblastus acidophilus]|uniref:ATP-dependent helicase Lhr and Lhr-like helicase n=1 Tax=Rhodoblastus acidophilus TaxID=1074 RepID=A0A212S0M0_RHOAC|nr:ligase-associated DNA damage response DEXH box helicase [Rhodoblastus acidophilus]PPQ38263.1 DNA ligase-associated DEXH box helicase [Rhodoblastus acidophilus]RAI21790.1 DNA ligase-associated DEXH box helicase [Rhodoblastus acidophilus]SNB78520.1 ATP-dependent helicase Lhr and Lhr-like helicase [Rhodoblastus acidophilus]
MNKPHAELPDVLSRWFDRRGWSLRAYQREVLDLAARNESALVIAPTGAGKTLAGFLPALCDVSRGAAGEDGLFALYISPLKALAVDVRRNLELPVAEIGLKLRIEARTGDTPASRRARQQKKPPHILLTTPEQVALMFSRPDSAKMFAGLRYLILDEIHALAPSKRGDLLALGLAQLAKIAPAAQRFGLSATVREPAALARWLASGAARPPRIVRAEGAPPPRFEILESQSRTPWAGHSARYAVADIYARLRGAKLSIVFVNTRLQAEMMFQLLWDINEDNLRIALHHGSLDRAHRRRVEAAMAEGAVDAVVATSTLDLGLDWGDVDLVIQVGAPKSASRLTQRVGRSNHRLDEPSQALLAPANRFEWLECVAAVEAVAAGVQDNAEGDAPERAGALDVLAQHVVSRLGAEPMTADALFAEIASAAPYHGVSRETFERVLAFARNGGYALKAYERFEKIRAGAKGVLRVANAKMLAAHRMNIGTITDNPMARVVTAVGAGRALKAGRELGTIDSLVAAGMAPGDTFYFGGEAWAVRELREEKLFVSRARANASTIIPSYMGGRLPVSESLAARVAELISGARALPFPPQVAEWLAAQAEISRIPRPGRLLAEIFPHAKRHYLALYPFAGRLAHQTLGVLLTRRLARAGLAPIGFAANDYAVLAWQLRPFPETGGFLEDLLAPDMLGDDLEEWLDESSIMKRAFRNCAQVAGLVERRAFGQAKSGRALTISSDLIYDVLRRYEPDHILLQAARLEASREMLDLDRLAGKLVCFAGKIDSVRRERPTPLAVPLLLEIGREKAPGDARDLALEELGDDLLAGDAR